MTVDCNLSKRTKKVDVHSNRRTYGIPIATMLLALGVSVAGWLYGNKIDKYISQINSSPIHFKGDGILNYRDFRCGLVEQKAVERQGVDALVNSANDHKFDRSRLQRLRPLAYTLKELESRGIDLNKLEGKIPDDGKPYGPRYGEYYPAPKCDVVQ